MTMLARRDGHSCHRLTKSNDCVGEEVSPVLADLVLVAGFALLAGWEIFPGRGSPGGLAAPGFLHA